MAVTWVSLMVYAFEAANLNVPELFESVGLDINALNDSRNGFKQDDLTRLWHEASRVSGNPAIGLLMANSPVVSVFNTFSYGILASENIESALARLIRYQRIIGEAMNSSLSEEPQGYRLNIHVEGHQEPLAYQGFDGALAIMLTTIRWAAQMEVTPLEICLLQPEPADRSPYDEQFRCPLKFNQPHTSVLFSRDDYIRPSPIGNKTISRMHDGELDQSIKDLDESSLTDKVIKLFTSSLVNQEPHIEDLASQLNMSKRTFQRRLKEEGWTFVALVDHTRKNMAMDYVLQPQYSLQQISHLLGFTEHSNFYRAFKRWYGVTPRQYRDQQQG
jgi:AraC-like DNA-binding protein